MSYFVSESKGLLTRNHILYAHLPSADRDSVGTKVPAKGNEHHCNVIIMMIIYLEEAMSLNASVVMSVVVPIV